MEKVKIAMSLIYNHHIVTVTDTIESIPSEIAGLTRDACENLVEAVLVKIEDYGLFEGKMDD